MFVLLTDPYGRTVWIVKTQIVAIIHPLACASDSHAQVITVTGSYCVAEDPEDVARKVGEQ